jgi:hypothetical protein
VAAPEREFFMKSLQPDLTRRRLLAALTGLASAVAIGASAGPVAAATSLGTAVIFGDAFSTMETFARPPSF